MQCTVIRTIDGRVETAMEAPDVVTRQPDEGDHVRLFDLTEIAFWTRQGVSTLRRWIASGKIGREFLTRPGGKIMMSGDQLARLIWSWRGDPEQEKPEQAKDGRPRKYIRRRDPSAQSGRGRS